MFGKTRDMNDAPQFDGPTIEDFFGDESAAAEVVRVDALHHRLTQVESQINSQFTSLATYAQIAQEQIELARAEAKASTERSEHRLTDLIERERADRVEAMESGNGVVSIGSARSAMDERLDALERSVAQIKIALDDCFAQQLALAGAINRLFEQQPGTSSPAQPAVVAEVFVAPPVAASRPAGQSFAPPQPCDPIPGLSLRLDIA